MRLTRHGIAYRVAQDLPEGSYVNLGIGIPSLVVAFLHPDKDIFVHSENGILGVGPVAAPGAEDLDLMNANKDHVTLRPGAAVFDHSLSFAMVRGGHLTHAVMGGIEVSQTGDLANWTGPDAKVPGVGGAMDLAAGTRNLFIAMTHISGNGEPKIVTQCTYPLTASRCVRRIYTDMAVIEVTPTGLVLLEVAPGLTPDIVRQHTAAPLRTSDALREMPVPASLEERQLYS